MKRKRRILIIDDELYALQDCLPILQENNIAVDGVSNVPEALKLLKTQRYDVIVFDLDMQRAREGQTLALGLDRKGDLADLCSAVLPENRTAYRMLYTGNPKYSNRTSVEGFNSVHAKGYKGNTPNLIPAVLHNLETLSHANHV